MFMGSSLRATAVRCFIFRFFTRVPLCHLTVAMIHRTVGDGRVFEVGTSITADDFPLLQLAVEYTVMKEVAIEECFHHRSRRKRVPSGYLFDACACEDKFVFFWIDQLWSTKCRLTLGTFNPEVIIHLLLQKVSFLLVSNCRR